MDLRTEAIVVGGGASGALMALHLLRDLLACGQARLDPWTLD
jgi:uncharacterized NAD(P)/FAD-binding protein YdhS